MEGYMNFFYHNICHTCKVNSPFLKKCAGCKLISYCSQSHQKTDWRHHKPLCTIVQDYYKQLNITSIFSSGAEDPEDWKKKCIAIICALELKLGRPLKHFEKQIFFFSNLCPVCFIFNTDKKYMCDSCNYICYCSLEHSSNHFIKHKIECSPLRTCYEIDKLCFKTKGSLVNFTVPTFEEDFFPESMDYFLMKYAGTEDEILRIFLSEHLSGTISLLHSIHSYMNVNEMEVLNIHIIGASTYEQSVIMTMEMLFHRFPCLKKINLVLIGPEINENYVEPVICDKCESNRLLTVSTEIKLYHQCIFNSKLSVPDLIFSFNCGFNEFFNTDNDTWQESLKCIFKFTGVLLAFTSYTSREAELDLSCVMEAKPTIVNVTPVQYQNPFRSLRPYRNWESSDCSVFYNNNYITIVKITN